MRPMRHDFHFYVTLEALFMVHNTRSLTCRAWTTCPFARTSLPQVVNWTPMSIFGGSFWQVQNDVGVCANTYPLVN